MYADITRPPACSRQLRALATWRSPHSPRNVRFRADRVLISLGLTIRGLQLDLPGRQQHGQSPLRLSLNRRTAERRMFSARRRRYTSAAVAALRSAAPTTGSKQILNRRATEPRSQWIATPAWRSMARRELGPR